MDAHPDARAAAGARAGAPAARDGSAGHRVYSTRFLALYDPLVLGFYTRWVWRCPLDVLVGNYRQHITPRHLDVGPGTGYFLERAGLAPDAAVTLADPNGDVLAFASQRLRALRPETVEADVCRALPQRRPYRSAALNLVLHCLPGPPSRKAAAIANVAAVLAPGGVLFGATVLGEPRLHTGFGRAALWWLNRQGIFDNGEDTEDGLRAMLAGAFGSSTVEVVGAVAVFSATAPRAARRG